jgi:Ca2+-binding RTX toxin-like protein
MDDTLDYSGSRTGVTIDLAAGVATGEGRDRLRGFSDVVGSPHGDVMRGDDGPNRLEGGAGHDRLSGRGGDDSLADGIVWSSLDAPRRYPGDDVLAGGPGDDSLALAGGTDTAEGGDGVDSFMSAGGRLHVISGGPEPGQKLAFFAGPARLDLRTGEGSLGPGTLEVFGIQHLSGSGEDAVLTGDGADNTIVGGAGDDDLDGGDGFDTLLHHSLVECFPCAPVPFEPVVVDLAEGTVSGHGSDAVAAFELVLGTPKHDVLLGGPGTDYLWAADGDDEVHGREGDDNLNGGFGDDTGNGGPGFDVCEFVEHAEECESP